MIVNVIASYAFYLVPVFLPRIIWLGLGPTLFGLGQFGIHGIQTPRKLGQFYNPGLLAVILLHFPIGIYYIYYIIVNHLSGVLDWVLGVIYMIAFMFIFLVKMTYSWLADEHSPYLFDDTEMKRFNVQEKIKKKNL